MSSIFRLSSIFVFLHPALHPFLLLHSCSILSLFIPHPSSPSPFSLPQSFSFSSPSSSFLPASSCSVDTLSTLLPSPLNSTSPLLYPLPHTHPSFLSPFLYPSSITPPSPPACHTTRCGVGGCHPQWDKGWYSQGPPPSRCVGVFGTGGAATFQLQAGQAREEGTLYQVWEGV